FFHSSIIFLHLHSFPTRRSSDLVRESARTTPNSYTGKALSEICALDSLAEIATVHLDHAAHLMQARAHALSDPVAERLLARCARSEEHTSELQSRSDLVCRLLLE